MLITLAYRIPPDRLHEVLGDVTAYPLTEEFRTAWGTLPARGTRRPPYKSLATALSAFSDRPVRLFPENDLSAREQADGTRALLVSDGAFGRPLAPAVRAWETRVRGGSGDPVLADLLPDPEHARSLADFVGGEDRWAPSPPSWVFRTAAWKVMSRLCHDLPLENGRTLTLRKDTSGRLLAWEAEDLVSDPKRTVFSMATISVALTSRRGMKDLVLSFDAHLTRLMRDGGRARNVWVSHHPGRPVLHLPLRWTSKVVDGEKIWVPGLDDTLTHVLSTLELAPITLPERFPGSPGTARPLASTNRFHRVGSGLGPRFMLRLHEHITRHLPELEPLEFRHDKRINLARRTVKYLKEGISPADIATSGFDRVTLACVYATPQAWQRMLGEITAMTGVSVRPEPNGSPCRVHDRLFVTAHHAPDLVAHGYRNRTARLGTLGLLDGIAAAESDGARPRTITAAWVETEYHPEATIEEPSDAKPHLRRVMAHAGIPTQFLATDPPMLPEGAEPRSKEEQGHMARAALRDLMRATGVVDARVFRAVTEERLREPLDRPTVLVGIHTRRQLSRHGESTPLRVLTMCALLLDPARPDDRRLLTYSDRRDGWVRLGEGTTDYHSATIGFAEYGARADHQARLRDTVEKRLRALSEEIGPDLPLVLLVNARATRSIWPGVSNTAPREEAEAPELTDPPTAAAVPGDSLRALGRDVAVVRINAAVQEVGRPVSRTDRANRPADERQPAAPGRKLYELADATEPTWYFPGRSVQSAAKFGDLPSKYTRWCDVPDGKQWRTPWHAFTACEIVVVRAGSWRPVALAALSARLSDQPLSWDGRTVAPVPLHLAAALDRNHPDHRADYEPDAAED